MFKKVLVFAAVAVFLIGVGCSNGTNPVTPDKTTSIEDYFNSFDLSNPAIGECTYYSTDGQVLSTAVIGRNDDNSLYIIESRGAQQVIDLTPMNFLTMWVTYQNPRGTIQTGPNMGLPWYYIGDTFTYDVHCWSWLFFPIGGINPPYGGFGPAHIRSEMHYSYFDTDGRIQAGPAMLGQFWHDWYGEISMGYNTYNDDYYIPGGSTPGLNVTTCFVHVFVSFGFVEYIFFDGVAGIWDPQ